jgi:hypothetical protein
MPAPPERLEAKAIARPFGEQAGSSFTLSFWVMRTRRRYRSTTMSDRGRRAR